MSVTPSIVPTSTNAYLTPQQSFQPQVGEMFTDGVVTSAAFAVTAQASPNMTVAVAPGAVYVTATPTSETARRVRADLSASYNVTIPSNATGVTQYDKVYVTLPAASLHTPAASGDLTEAATILVQRDATSGVALTATNSLLLAEIATPNSATSIITGYITDRRAIAAISQVNLPADSLGYVASAVVSQNTITTEVDITGLTVTVTVPAGGRSIRIIGRVGCLSSVSLDTADLRIKEGSTQLIGSRALLHTAATDLTVAYVGTPTAGSHTYKLSVARSAGTGTLTVSSAATYQAFILVELI